jgi:hypothetical protein
VILHHPTSMCSDDRTAFSSPYGTPADSTGHTRLQQRDVMAI